jgi:hypothetical protein
MALKQPKKVLYAANERLDLIDVLAQDSTRDDNDNQNRFGSLLNDPDGRVFSGWLTSTTTGANSGFTIAAAPSCAMDRAGNLLILDGSASLSVTMPANTISYIHAYYAETPSDTAQRRFFNSGSEVMQNTSTRVTRAPNLYRTTTAYGTPAWAGFNATAVIGGSTVQLLPLYAVAVDGSNSITAVLDFRPMFAMGAGAAGGNQYEAQSGNADLPFNFSPSDAATLGIGTMRKALVALADRIKNIKGSTQWYDDAANQWLFSGGTLSSPGATQINFNADTWQIGTGYGATETLNFFTGADTGTLPFIGNEIASQIKVVFNNGSLTGGGAGVAPVDVYWTAGSQQFIHFRSDPAGGSSTFNLDGFQVRVIGSRFSVDNHTYLGGFHGAVNVLDVNGSVVIGGSLAGSVAAPGNGLQVQGSILTAANQYTYPSQSITQTYGSQTAIPLTGTHSLGGGGGQYYTVSGSGVSMVLPLTLPQGVLLTQCSISLAPTALGGGYVVSIWEQNTTTPATSLWGTVTFGPPGAGSFTQVISVTGAGSGPISANNTYYMTFISTGTLASTVLAGWSATYTSASVPVQLNL